MRKNFKRKNLITNHPQKFEILKFSSTNCDVCLPYWDSHNLGHIKRDLELSLKWVFIGGGEEEEEKVKVKDSDRNGNKSYQKDKDKK